MKINVTGVFIASLAGLLFGFDTAVISGVTSALRAVYHLSDANLGLAVSAGLWGTFVGALFMGRMGDAIGGRDALRVIALMYVLATLGSAFAPGLWPFVGCRFVLGLAIGGSSVLAPVYISEIVPAEKRGQLVGLFQFNIVFGILLAYLSNYSSASSSAGRTPGAGSWASPPCPPASSSPCCSPFRKARAGWWPRDEARKRRTA
ncbi:MAG: MFS transporter [Asticcacaulis sp.]